ncbi:MAG: glutamate racemase [Candidatus Omnitrophica bacterium]|nr:glutamate racemase [Candidatus Omnitrophota bacterium]
MKSLQTRPIGIFDSGVGGLTVVKNVRRHLPEEDILYFGDTARVPYGNKSRDTIVRFSLEIMAFMLECRVKMVIVACNTASSLALPFLRKYYSIPIVGVITPGVREAARSTKNGRIGVIGTESTISSKAYDRELRKNKQKGRIFSKGCPLFVPLVENRFTGSDITYQIVGHYLKSLKQKKIDTLILGCTHYPVLRPVISKVMGSRVKLIDSSLAVAKEVKEILVNEKLAAPEKKRKARSQYYVSDDVKGFCKTANIFLKEKISAKKVVL